MGWQSAVLSDAEVLFHLGANIITVSDDIKAAKRNGKFVFIHIDLADGIGKDKAGIHWLKTLGADGIISTRAQLIRTAHDSGLLAVQRFFILDSKGMHSISKTIENTRPDLIEIMPGVIPKALKAVAAHKIPIIAGGLIETKQEVTAALSADAIAVSTGKKELWNEIESSEYKLNIFCGVKESGKTNGCKKLPFVFPSFYIAEFMALYI